MVKKFLYYAQLILIFLVFWIALFETIDIQSILFAVISIIIILFISEKFFMETSFYEAYPFNIFKLTLFFCVLIYEIYLAGFSTIIRIITGQINPGIIEISTDLPHEFQRSILANSITLTPGTVTVNLNRQNIRVLWLDVKTKNPTIAGVLIKGNLEKYLH